MRFLRTYARTLTLSLSEPAYYGDIFRAPFWFSVKFFLTSFFLLSVWAGVLFATRDIPKVALVLDSISAQIRDHLRADATLSYHGGKITSQAISLPFILTRPDALQNSSFPEKILILQKEETAQKALFTLTPTQVIVSSQTENEDAAHSSLPYTNLFEGQEWILTKPQMTNGLEQMKSSLQQGAPFLLLASIPFTFTGQIISDLLLLVFLTLFTQSFAWIWGIRLPFVKVFQMGLHAIVASEFAHSVQLTFMPTFTFPIVITGYVGIMTLVLWQLRKKSKVNSPPEKQ